MITIVESRPPIVPLRTACHANHSKIRGLTIDRNLANLTAITICIQNLYADVFTCNKRS